MPEFDEPGSKVAQFYGNSELMNKAIQMDGLSWFRKRKGQPILKPRKSTMKLEGRSYLVANCTHANTDVMKKYVISSDDRMYVIYISNGVIQDEDILKSQKRQKINDDTANLVRQALVGRNVKNAEIVLRQQNVEVSLKQITNQARNVSSSMKTKRGIRPATIPSDLAEFARKTPNSEFFSSSSEYRLIVGDEDLISVYINNLPTAKKLNRYRNQFENLETWSSGDLNDYLDKNASYFNSGIDERMVGQLQVDCTFDLSSCYVTLLTADMPHFLTKSSGKIRYMALAFMLHSSKSGCHHEAFGQFIQSNFERLDKTGRKKVPSICTDGETSFKYYRMGAHMEMAIELRCEIHRRSNLVQRFGKDTCRDSVLKKMFGKMDGDRYLKRGIFNSFSLDQYERKLEKSDMESNLKDWLTQNKVELFETHSMKSKLLAGIVVQFSTTNKVECINSKLKTFILRPESGRVCAEKIMLMIEEEKRAVLRSVTHGDDRLIIYDRYKSTEDMSVSEKAKHLAKLGLRNLYSVIYEIPPELKIHFFDVCLNDVQALNVVELGDRKFLVPKSVQSSEFVQVNFDDETQLMKCSRYQCHLKLPAVCIHLSAAISRVERTTRQNFFDSFKDYCESVSKRKSERSMEKVGQAKRFKRKFKQFSKKNHSRTIQGIASDPELSDEPVQNDTEIMPVSEDEMSAIIMTSGDVSAAEKSENDDEDDSSVTSFKQSSASSAPLTLKQKFHKGYMYKSQSDDEDDVLADDKTSAESTTIASVSFETESTTGVEEWNSETRSPRPKRHRGPPMRYTGS
ncbi:hypothetical protein L3Y34_019319 [Caenorhabditis briggsae]|uniref:Uncharacterized protein n=1 Tax=Caenorhabditis briggsae TaxID=6238 RepID=A0AAE9DQJ4_CAEBR|nr:hypothetical protein L3Y34_019319 [Caenorhabditis briggsae]